jgi:hypothetical protein
MKLRRGLSEQACRSERKCQVTGAWFLGPSAKHSFTWHLVLWHLALSVQYPRGFPFPSTFVTT